MLIVVRNNVQGFDYGFRTKMRENFKKSKRSQNRRISKNHERRRGKIVPAVVSCRRRQQSINLPFVKCLRWPQLESWSRGDAARVLFLLIGDEGRRGQNWVKNIKWLNGKAIQATLHLNEDSLKLSELAFPRKAILCQNKATKQWNYQNDNSFPFHSFQPNMSIVE